MRKSLASEFVGSLLLTAIVVGSGIAAQILSPHDLGIELLENALATTAGLYVLILLFQPVSGAHFNPVVSLLAWGKRQLSGRQTLSYVIAQIMGCTSGALLANAMFGRRLLEVSTRHRLTGPHALSEVIATFGLLILIFGLSQLGKSVNIPAAVGAYIGCAYFFTSSTSFANPAITVGREFSNTFAGIAPSSVWGFVGAQMVGLLLAVGFLQLISVSTTTSEIKD